MNEGAVWHALMEQGPLVLVLIIAILYFYRRDQKNEKREQENSDRCRDSSEKIMARLLEMNDRLMSNNEKNTEVIERIGFVIEDYAKRDGHSTGIFHQPNVSTHAR